MDSKNRTPRNEKQEELIKRLEQIRRQRETIQSTENKVDKKQSAQRNRIPQESRSRQKNRQSKPQKKQNEQRNTQNRNMNKTQQPSENGSYNKTHSAELKKEIGDYYNKSTITQGEIQDSIRKKDLARKNKNKKNNQTKSLINQLSSGENLAQALILNEILSKPIALRYKNR